MQTLITSLKNICHTNLFQEKFLIVPSNSAGVQILQALTMEGCSFINLRAVTLYDMAFEMCAQNMYENKLCLAEDVTMLRYMINDLKKMKEDKQFWYFNKIEITPQISSSMLSSIKEMRKAGLTSDDLQEDNFIAWGKGLDIKRLLKCYEDTLKDNCLVDQADIYRIACEVVKDNGKRLFYCVPDMEMSAIETRFLEKITNGQCIELPINKIIDENNNFELFQAYGAYNEVHEVIKRIKKLKMPLDDVAVFYTETNTYSQLFYDAGVKYRVHFTFGDGVDIRNTTSGRLLFSVLKWVKGGYSAEDLYDIFVSGDFSAGGKADISAGMLAYSLNKIKIGWDRKRYIPFIVSEVLDCTNKLNAAAEDLKDKYILRLAPLEALKTVVEDILSSIPEANSLGIINYNSLAKGLSTLLEKYTNIKGLPDGEAKKSIIETLKSSILSNEDIMNITEAVQLVETLISGIRVSASNPKAGHIHIVNYRNGLYVNRSNSFLIGMDSSRFPGNGLEDPVLLDIERVKISKELEERKLSIKNNNERLNNLIASLHGKVAIGYSSFDTFESRVQYPAFIMLKIYRLIATEDSADYTKLISSFKEQAGFFPQKPEDSLEEGEWWLSSAMESRSAIEIESVEKSYFTLQKGLDAIKQRKSELITCFNGKLLIDLGELDPRNNKSRVMSSSQLETLGKCPYKYFLQNILRLYVPEELEYDAGKWLDAATKGTLLHSVFEDFYRLLKQTNEKPSLEKHGALIYEIAEVLVNKYREAIPVPNEIVFEAERKDIFDICRVFLSSEALELRNAEPIYFELSFGKKDLNEEIGEIDAVEIETNSGDKLYLSGVIDRVDRLSPEKYRIIDYKTGSTFGYDGIDVFKGGRQLQHALYSCAFEQILRDKNISENPAVLTAEYIFPTVKGNGQRFVRLQASRDEFFEILDKLVDHLKDGDMHMTEDINDCKFCDYITVCERPSISKGGDSNE